jgi:hypothetical protein
MTDDFRDVLQEELAPIKRELAAVRAATGTVLLEARLRLLTWIAGFNLALTIAIVGMLILVLASELADNAAVGAAP